MRGGEGGPGSAIRGAVVELALWGAALFGVTLVSITSVGPVESAVAGCAAFAGALVARAIRRAIGGVPFGGRGAPAAAAALPWTLLRGCFWLALAVFGGTARLGRGRTGPGVRRVTLREGAGPAWAGLVLAASPDTCLVDAGDDTVDAHMLRLAPNAAERAVARGSGTRW